jgi:phospholipid/cholesterol/gamma-HCH transport system permease protein
MGVRFGSSTAVEAAIESPSKVSSAPPLTQVALRQGPAGSVLALSGPLDVETAATARRGILAQAAAHPVTALEVDASGIERGDMSGMALLYELREGRLLPGVRAAVKGLRPEFETLLQAFPTAEALASAEEKPRRSRLPEEIGRSALSVAADLREQVVFVGAVTQGFAAAARRPRSMRWPEVARVFEKAGANALPIVGLISLLTGIIIAFEAAQPLEMFGAQIFIADMIGLVMIREFSPIFTAIILAGRSGSAFAAEIGTMKVNEELNALETMGLDPIRFLVLQRVLAATLMMPFLTAYSMGLGVFGGVLVMQTMGFPLEQIWTQLTGAVHIRDVVVGVSKSVVFAVVVSGLGCLRGIQTRQGPTAVGDSATRAVVAGILMIIVVDAVFAVLTYVLHV